MSVLTHYLTNRPGHDESDVDGRILFWTGVAVIATQRLALPLGTLGVPVTLAVIFIAAAIQLFRGRWVITAIGLIIFATFVACGAASVVVNGATGASLTSFILVAALWVSAVIAPASLSSTHRSDGGFARGVVAASAVASLLGVVQSAWTASGRLPLDPIGKLPGIFQMAGYRADQPVEFGGTWMKANGMLMLEPSFLSLFAALSLVFLAANVARYPRRTRYLLITLLLCGMLSSVAISGLVVLVAIPFIALRSLRLFFGSVALLAGVVFSGIFTPIGRAFFYRIFVADGSNDARLVRPYFEILPIWLRDHLLVGEGPGAARDLADMLTAGNWESEVTTPTVVKLLFEYGILGTVAFLLMVSYMTASSRLPVGVKLALLIALFVPTDGLTSHVIAPVVIFVLMSKLPVFAVHPAPVGTCNSRPTQSGVRGLPSEAVSGPVSLAQAI